MEKRTEDLIVRYLEDIARSLRIISRREDAPSREIIKKTYKDKYFSRDK